MYPSLRSLNPDLGHENYIVQASQIMWSAAAAVAMQWTRGRVIIIERAPRRAIMKVHTHYGWREQCCRLDGKTAHARNPCRSHWRVPVCGPRAHTSTVGGMTHRRQAPAIFSMCQCRAFRYSRQ